MKNKRMPNTQMAAVDDALRTYPLTPAPASLRPGVVTRLRALAPAPRFRLQFLDYAISLFGAGMLGLAVILWRFITPQMAAHAQLEWLYLAQVLRFNAAALGPALALGTGLAACAAVVAVVVLSRGSNQAVRS